MTITLFYVLCCDSRAVLEESPYSRMKSVVRWYLSGFYKKPKVHVLCIDLHMQLRRSAFITMHVCVDTLQVKPTCLYLCKVVKHTHEHVHTHTHAHLNAHACTHMCRHMHTRIYMHIHTRAHTHTHTHMQPCT